MRLDPNDPRITAYVLGELEDEKDRQAIEAAMADCGESRAFVEQTREMTRQLAELGALSEQAPTLDGARRDALEQRIAKPSDVGKNGTAQRAEKDQPAKSRRRWSPWLRWGLPLSAAASLVIVVGVGGVSMMKESFAPATQALAGDPATEGEKGSSTKRLLTLAPGDRPAKTSDTDTSVSTPRLGRPAHRYGGKAGGGAPVLDGLIDGTLGSGRVSRPRGGTERRERLRRRVARTGALKILSSKTATDRGLRSGHEQEAEEKRPAEDNEEDYDGRRRNSSERYAPIADNPFVSVVRAPLSTFSVDVDTASYSNMRRFLLQGRLPPPGSVRIEELVNYFNYEYAPPRGEHPFAVQVDLAPAPWNRKHQLMRIGIKGRVIAPKKRPPSNLVFLLDVSGSMHSPNKLPLLKRAFSMLVRRLDEHDRVAIVVYAGASGMVLPSTVCSQRNRPRILAALANLSAGGSTNGGAGIELAYGVAMANQIRRGVNRVILATDGDFNVGASSRAALLQLVKRKAKSGVYLTVLGFGMGNYKDGMLELISNKGNGNYGYIDTEGEARKMLVEQMSGTLVTIAKDVKLQLEFNPRHVAGYRLIGYENRRLKARDFKDDKKDAGEIGAGHTVTALYELVPAGKRVPGVTGVPRLRYQRPGQESIRLADELLTVKLRYKRPLGHKSTLITKRIAPSRTQRMGSGFKFAAAVAWFGMTLRGSPHAGKHPDPLDQVLLLARPGVREDRFGYRAEFLQLVQRARRLRGGR